MNTETMPHAGSRSDHPKSKRKPAKKTKAINAQAAVNKSKPKADRTNKKAEVVSLMKRATGAMLAEIVKATDWQSHTVRGFVSILGSNGGEKIESTVIAE
jgi:hypothetical protein